jgi:putative hydrolase of the HAD superfamily
MPFDAIIFDLDDTLYKELDFVESGFFEVAKFLSRTGNHKIGVEVIHSKMLESLHLSGRGKVFNDVLEWLELNVNEYLSTLLYIYRNHLPENILLDSAMKDLLDELRNTNVKLGVITDGTFVTQKNKTNILFQDFNLDCIIHTDSLGSNNWKPSSEPFKVASKLLDVNPNKAVYIGDNPVKDFKGARSIGMKAIWWNPESKSFNFEDEVSKPDFTVSNIQMLREQLIGC